MSVFVNLHEISELKELFPAINFEELSNLLLNSTMEFGSENAYNLFVEEIAELIYELIDYNDTMFETSHPNKEHVQEELIDVFILLMNLVLEFGFNSNYFLIIEGKTGRKLIKQSKFYKIFSKLQKNLVKYFYRKFDTVNEIKEYLVEGIVMIKQLMDSFGFNEKEYIRKIERLKELLRK